MPFNVSPGSKSPELSESIRLISHPNRRGVQEQSRATIQSKRHGRIQSQDLVVTSNSSAEQNPMHSQCLYSQSQPWVSRDGMALRRNHCTTDRFLMEQICPGVELFQCGKLDPPV